MAVQLLRNTRLWVSTVLTGHSTANTWEIRVQDDLSFSQSNTTSDVEVSEAGATPTRGSARFNDALEPADWSFSTYINTFLFDPDNTPSSGDEYKLTPDAILWHSLASGSPFDPTGTNGLSSNSTNMMVNFLDSQHHELLKFHIYMLVDNIWYVIENCQVAEGSISNDIAAIGAMAWSGQGTEIVPLDAAPFVIADVNSVDCNLEVSYIRNKLTVLKVKDNETGKVYNIPITGGSVTFNNNITFLTPSTLACLDVPIGSYTGALAIEGEMSAYLDTRIGGTAELLKDLLAKKAVTTDFEIAVCMGGIYDTPTPGAVIVIPHAQLAIPSIESADVIGTSFSFKAMSSDFAAGDQAFLGFSDTFTTAQINQLIQTGNAGLANISLEATVNGSAADGIATNQVTATVLEADGVTPVVDGTVVYWTNTNSATPTAVSSTTTSGVATMTFTDTVAETSVVTGTLDNGDTSTVSINFV